MNRPLIFHKFFVKTESHFIKHGQIVFYINSQIIRNIIISQIYLLTCMQDQQATQLNSQNTPFQHLNILGEYTKNKLGIMKILIIGLRGLGIQISRNLIFLQPKSIAVYDQTIVKVQDLGSNFYLKEQDIGKKTRADACINNIAILNSSVRIFVERNNTPTHIVNNYECLVVTDNYDKKYLVQLNNLCRQRHVGFIYTGSLGLYGFAFVDFGDQHKVFNLNGQQNKSFYVRKITKDKNGKVEIYNTKGYGFEDQDYITFKEVKGMNELNGKIFKIKLISRYQFCIGDTSSFGEYQFNGIVQEVKIPAILQFKSLEKSLKNLIVTGRNGLDYCNQNNIRQSLQLHIILNSILQFYQKYGHIPHNFHQKDAEELVNIAKNWIQQVSMSGESQYQINEINQELVKNVSMFSNTQISPCTSFWGGIVCQEIIKFTGKYTPIRQWFHHQFLQLLKCAQISKTINNSKYSDYIALFGNEFLDAVSKVNILLVGAGSLDSQFIKLFSLMGFGIKGNISVSDNGSKQILNKNPLFFIDEKIGESSKSQRVCRIGKIINSEITFHPLKFQITSQNQEILDDYFWQKFDFIISTSNNEKQKQYIDSKCVWYQKCLFRAQTSRTKCFSQVIIPKLTQSYSDTKSYSQPNIPLGTISKHPYQIQHIIDWSRSHFQSIFVDQISKAAKFCQNQKLFYQLIYKNENCYQLKERLEQTKKLIRCYQTKSFQACVQLAKGIFQKLFYHNIIQLIHYFPLDEKTESGQLFWSGLKRAPSPIKFDSQNVLHLKFIRSAANIYSNIFGIQQQEDLNLIGKIANQIQIPKFSINQNKTQEQQQKDIQTLKQQLGFFNISSKNKCKSIQFDLNSPKNYHMEFILATTNLRAVNYQIQKTQQSKIKQIISKSIPTIVTSTTTIAGITAIQIIKKVLDINVSTFKDSYINLASPEFVSTNPLPPKLFTDKQYDELLLCQVKAFPKQFTNWDKLVIDGPMTIKEMIIFFLETYKVDLNFISIGQYCIYSSYLKNSKNKLHSNIMDIYAQLQNKPFSEKKKYVAMLVAGETSDGIEAIFPVVKYKI